jgi:hypothetical protein
MGRVTLLNFVHDAVLRSAATTKGPQGARHRPHGIIAAPPRPAPPWRRRRCAHASGPCGCQANRTVSPPHREGRQPPRHLRSRTHDQTAGRGASAMTQSGQARPTAVLRQGPARDGRALRSSVAGARRATDSARHPTPNGAPFSFGDDKLGRLSGPCLLFPSSFGALPGGIRSPSGRRVNLTSVTTTETARNRRTDVCT